MKDLIIIGAGGMGKEIYYLATQCIGYNTDYRIKGFLDFQNENWNCNIYPSIIGIEDDYQIQPDDVFVCSIGDIALKKKVCEKILNKGGKFYTLIHPLAQLAADAKIGEGCIIDKFAVIGADAVIGDYCLIQIGSVIGHDVHIGKWNRIDCHVVCVGGVEIGNEVCIHTGAVINHHVVVEDRAIIAALSFVIRKVKAGVTVYGNPAKILL